MTKKAKANALWGAGIGLTPQIAIALYVLWDTGRLHSGNLIEWILIASNIALWLAIAYNLRGKSGNGKLEKDSGPRKI